MMINGVQASIDDQGIVVTPQEFKTVIHDIKTDNIIFFTRCYLRAGTVNYLSHKIFISYS